MTDTTNDLVLLPQGIRTPSDRREAGIVPAGLPSLSSNGPPEACPAGASGENASATKTTFDLTDAIDGDGVTTRGNNTPSQRPGPQRSKGRTSRGRSGSASSRASTGVGVGDDVETMSVSSGGSDEDGSFRTPPARTPVRLKMETRGRNPKDPVARAAKMENKKLRAEVRKMEVAKRAAEERAQLAEELSRRMGSGLWEAAPTSSAVPAAKNLPAQDEAEAELASQETAYIMQKIAEHAERVDYWAYACQNLLSGTTRKELRIAALVGKVGARILSKRMAGSPATAATTVRTATTDARTEGDST